MNKQQLAETLAQALNLLNGMNSDMNTEQQQDYHDILSSIPTQLLDRADFYNNGELAASDLLSK